MVTWIWLAVCLPGYLAIAGYARNFAHTSPGHNQYRCGQWDDPPCWLWAGLMWPVTGAVVVLSVFWRLGMAAEQQRPVHRRAAREAARAKDLRMIP